MNFTIKRFLTLLIIFCVGTAVAHGQISDNRKTEREIKIEDQFVQAKFLEISGKTDEAIKLLDTIRRASPENATIYFELAKLYYSKNDWTLTETNISKAKKIQPTNPIFQEFEVEYFLAQNRTDEAISSLNYLLTIQPKNQNYYRELVGIQKKNGRYSDALNTLNLKEKNLGSSDETTLKKAELFTLDGKINEAVNTLNEIASRYPQNTAYLKRIVNLLHTYGKTKEMEPYLKRILELDPNDNDAKLGLILLSNKNLNEDEKLVTLYPMVKNPEIQIDVKIKELLPYLQKQALTEDSILNSQLIDISDKLVIAHPNEAKAHAFYADALKNSGNIKAAIRQYTRTLELNKNIYAVWEQLMYCLNATEDYDKLDVIANEAIDYFPNQALSYCFAAKAAQQKDNLKKSMSLLDDALLISAGNKEIESRVWVIKAGTALKQKNLNQATEYVQNALNTSNQQNGDAWELKGDIAYTKDQTKEAASLWEKAIELGGNKTRLLTKLKTLKKT